MIKKDLEMTQPFLLAITIDGGVSVPNQMFVVLDYQIVLVPGNVSRAIEMLFACFFAFNVQYPGSLVNVYQFLENIFGLKCEAGKNVSSAVAKSLSIKIKKQLESCSQALTVSLYNAAATAEHDDDLIIQDVFLEGNEY